MLDFGAVKCDLFHPRREASFSIKMLWEIIDDSLMNCDSIVQIRVKIASKVFGRPSSFLMKQKKNLKITSSM